MESEDGHIGHEKKRERKTEPPPGKRYGSDHRRQVRERKRKEGARLSPESDKGNSREVAMTALGRARSRRSGVGETRPERQLIEVEGRGKSLSKTGKRIHPAARTQNRTWGRTKKAQGEAEGPHFWGRVQTCGIQKNSGKTATRTKEEKLENWKPWGGLSRHLTGRRSKGGIVRERSRTSSHWAPGEAMNHRLNTRKSKGARRVRLSKVNFFRNAPSNASRRSRDKSRA